MSDYLPPAVLARIGERIEADCADDLAAVLGAVLDALEGARFPTEPAVATAATVARAGLARYARVRGGRDRHPSQWSVVR